MASGARPTSDAWKMRSRANAHTSLGPSYDPSNAKLAVISARDSGLAMSTGG
jgi:hypothetical protein